ncbi:hypothetical protein HY312_03555 [Candidatus Saccharibacteria bacterium]|nr:hypothetical protein [Candidatus Saccharibacteria bacterium]
MATTTEIVPTKKTWKRPGIIWPFILMVWPAVSLILAILLYAIIALVFSTTQQPTSGGEADLFDEESTNPVRVTLKILHFIVGAGAVALGPISFIVGLVLLIVNLNKK